MALVIGGLLLGLFVAELAARAWVAWRWPARQVTLLTSPSSDVRGRFAYDPVVGYALAPNFKSPNGRTTHNALGFRGAPASRQKAPGAVRVVIAGGSTVYGPLVDDGETSAAQLQRILGAGSSQTTVEVFNAGVPNWTSAETLRSFETRIAPLEPDVLVVMDGRNDMFPALFNGYRDDYGHYRNAGHDFRPSNLLHKRLFSWSRLAMVLCVRGSGRFGYSAGAEHPAYASIRNENVPDLDQLRANAADPRRSEQFRRNQARLVEVARARGVDVVLATVPFLPERYNSGVIRPDPAARPVLASVVRRHQQITREVAARYQAVLVDTVPIATGQYLGDDCHFNVAGEQVLARLLADAIRPILAGRSAQRTRNGEHPRL